MCAHRHPFAAHLLDQRTGLLNVFWRTPHAWRKAAAWPRDEREFVRRAGFALMACLAWHDHDATDAAFRRLLPIIERTATDDRNFAVQASPEFQELRSRLRRFVFPTTVFFLIWYASYVLLGAFSHDFMATKVWGNVNVGLLLGLGQFLTTFLITGLYIRFANRELDPKAAALRTEMHWAEQ